jgi:thiol-disulfide isomerase/thioredoxin
MTGSTGPSARFLLSVLGGVGEVQVSTCTRHLTKSAKGRVAPTLSLTTTGGDGRFRRPFSTTIPRATKNRVLDPFRTPPQFHDALRLCSGNDTLLLALFTTSSCAPCRVITPLLTSLVETRPASPDDSYSHLALAEVELDSPDQSNGTMMDLGVEYGVTSMPTLIGFGGRRAERVTDRLVDTRFMSNPQQMAAWVDEQMKRGDPFPGQKGGGGGGGGGGILSRIFG